MRPQAKDLTDANGVCRSITAPSMYREARS